MTLLTPEQLARDLMELTLARIERMGIQVRLQTNNLKATNVEPVKLLYRNVLKEGRVE